MKRLLRTAMLLSAPIIFNKFIKNFIDKPVSYGFIQHTYNYKHGGINYIIKGKGEPLLLLHDTKPGFSLREWENQINELSIKYKVYAVDFLGFGNSERPFISYSPYLFTLMINDFIKDVIKEKTYVIASGKAADFTLLAAKFSPELFKKIIAVSPEGLKKTKYPDDKFVFLRWLYESPVIGETIYNVSMLINKPKFSDFGSQMPFAALNSRFLNANIRHVVSNLETETKFVFGGKDDNSNLQNLYAIKKAGTNINIAVFKLADKYPHTKFKSSFNNLCLHYFK